MVIAIENINQINEFVTRATEVDGDVILQRGKFCIDAKSILGVMAINIAAGAVIEYPASAVDFENYIKQFEVS